MLTELNQFWGSYTVYTDIIINLSARELVVAYPANFQLGKYLSLFTSTNSGLNHN